MPLAVRFNEYGGIDVPQVVEVDRPVPGPGQVLVKVKAAGINPGASAEVLAELAGWIDSGALEIPIARVYPLAQVRDAYRELKQRHTRGKIVLVP